MKVFPDKSFTEIAESIAKTIGVGVAVWGVWVYFADLHRQRIEETFSYQDEFFTGEVALVRTNIELALSLALKSIEQAPVDKQAQMIEGEFNQLSSLDKRLEFLLLLGFFDRLKSCVEIYSCDLDTAKNLFSDSAQYYAGIFESKIESERKYNGDFGNGILYIKDL